ncbi:MAG: InlB B-repeat-containing protein [Nitrososphaerota archaeon]|jgi:uncharacterized repeat protein (TIGR02543 family)|nr:InlB B-repeat-containing protein [Nitrososphaerota archaeon]
MANSLSFVPNWPSGSTGTGNPPGTIWTQDTGPYTYFDMPGNTGNLAKPGYQWLGWSWSNNASAPDYTGGEQQMLFDIHNSGELDDLTLYAVWKAISSSFTMLYNGNGNTGGSAPVDSNSPYLYGVTVTILGSGNLTKTNNTFIGWSTNQNATAAQYTQGQTFAITGNTTLYAVWSPPLSVIYNGNGNSAGAAPVDSSSPYVHGSTVTVLGNTSGLWLTGCNFAGWSTDPLDVWPTLSPGGTFTITENTTLYAIWLYGGPPVGNLYSVIYNGNGNTSGYPPTDWTYPAGATVTVLGRNTLEKTGYTFLGWATTSNAITPNRMPGSTFNMSPNSITLYAVWQANSISTYTVAYNGNGNTGGSVPVDGSSPYVSGSTVIVLGQGTLTKSNYVFLGWSTNSLASSAQYTQGSTFSIAQNTILYAVWQAIPKYTVAYNGNGNTGGSVPVDSNSPYTSGATVTVLGNTGNLVKSGYRFLGWNTSSSATVVQYVAGSTFTIVANTLLYAVWKQTFTITYNGNGSTGGFVPVDGGSPYDSGLSVTVLGNLGNLVKPSHIFLGWNTNSSAVLAQYTQGSTFTITQNITLYAIWQLTPTPSTYAVLYDGNGSTGGSVPVDGGSPYVSGVLVTVLGNTGGLSRSGFSFMGWRVNHPSASTVRQPGYTFNASENITFYAYWVARTCNVTYVNNVNSAGVVPEDTNSPYAVGSTVTVLGNIGGLWRSDAFVAGWSADSMGELPTIFAGETFIITEDVVLYAIWFSTGPAVGNMYSVFYNGNGSTSGDPPSDDSTHPVGDTVTVLGRNTLEKAGYTFLGWATTSNETKPNHMPGSTFGMPPKSVTLYAVWGSGGGGGGGGTIVVPYNGCYVGNGSKQSVVAYNGASTIMQVVTNLPNDTGSSAVIENLIIDGLNLSNSATGILLEDVCGCLVRNVTIMRCKVGIRVRLSGGNGGFSRGNRFEHIRLIDVETGILFEGTSGAKDFSYTSIEDVGISLAGNSSDVGIKVGTNSTNANLCSAFIKANIWLNGSNGAGLIVNGQLKGSLVNLAVAENTPSNSGKCIVLNSGACVEDNQSFLSASMDVATNISNNGGTHSGIKTVP